MGIPLKKYTGIVLQVLLMYGFYWIGNLIQAVLHLPLTGSIVGMLVLFITIQLGWIKMSLGRRRVNVASISSAIVVYSANCGHH